MNCPELPALRHRVLSVEGERRRRAQSRREDLRDRGRGRSRQGRRSGGRPRGRFMNVLITQAQWATGLLAR
jgi:hypothetical protein